jgi:hypothetical protein
MTKYVTTESDHERFYVFLADERAASYMIFFDDINELYKWEAARDTN